MNNLYTRSLLFLSIIFALSILLPSTAIAASYLSDGVIDVTDPPAGLQPARGDGSSDDTQRLQAIFNYAYPNRYAVMLPGDDGNNSTAFKGDYLISDTLKMFSNATPRQTRKGERAHVVFGSTQGKAVPIIRLKANAPKFSAPLGNQAAPGESRQLRPVFMITANQGDGEVKPFCDPYCAYNTPGDNFEQTLKNVRIIVETGNPTAVGINFPGAQHSVLEDITIELKSGLAGFDSLPGVSSVLNNLTVIGGDYGFYGVVNRNENGYRGGDLDSPALNNVTFKNQKVAAIYKPSALGALTLVGFTIEKQSQPAIVTHGQGFNFEMSLVDGTIVFTNDNGKPAIDNSADEGINFENVYVKNSAKIITSASQTLSHSHPSSSFVRVSEYAYTKGTISVNGSAGSNPVVGSVAVANPTQDVLLQSHAICHDTRSFDHLLEEAKKSGSGVCNIRSNPFGAKGNGTAYDTNAIKTAINQCNTVLVPKGTYLIDDTLTLKAQTQLIGINTSLSRFSNAKPGAPRKTETWKPTSITPMIQTVDNANATTSVQNILIEIATNPKENDWFIGLDWRAGKNSLVRNVYTQPLHSPDGNASNPKPQDRITGNGGGKWFGYDGIGSGPDAAVSAQNRKLLVTGTSQPLVFYNLSNEDGRAHRANSKTGFQSEFNSASNLSVYGTKNENCNPYLFNNVSNFSLFGLGKQHVSLVVKDSSNIKFAGVVFKPGNIPCATGYFPDKSVVEVEGTTVKVQTPADKNVTLYKKGQTNRAATAITCSGVIAPTSEPTSTNPTPTTVQPTDGACGIVGDIDCSGKVNAADLTYLLSNFGTVYQPADLDSSGKVNAADLTILLQNFGRSDVPTSGPTQQPSVQPTNEPTVEPTTGPTVGPSLEPTVPPTPGPKEKLVYDDIIQFTEVGRFNQDGRGFYTIKRQNTLMPGMPNDLTTPDDYYNGDWSFRYIVTEHPSGRDGRLQVCIWNMGGPINFQPENCAPIRTHREINTPYTITRKPADWCKIEHTSDGDDDNCDGDPLDFSNTRSFLIRAVLKSFNAQGETCSVTNYNVPGSCWEQFPDYADMKVRVTIVRNPAGDTFSGWQNYE